jgi:hypothetical protein
VQWGTKSTLLARLHPLGKSQCEAAGRHVVSAWSQCVGLAHMVSNGWGGYDPRELVSPPDCLSSTRSATVTESLPQGGMYLGRGYVPPRSDPLREALYADLRHARVEG